MEGLVQACLQGSAMALVVLVARTLLSRLLPRWIFPALWTIVLVRFLLPFDFTARKALSRSTGEVEQIPSTVENPVETIAESVDEAVGAVLSQDAPWGLIWAVGSAVALLALAILYGIQSRTLHGAKPAAPTAFLEAWFASHQLRRNLWVMESTMVRTPVARGFFHPSIVIPTGYLSGDKEKVRAALEHEFAHIRRFDPTVRAAALLAVCLYWFNPLVWMAYFSVSRDQELACDESALRRLGNGARRSYVDALLDAAAASVKLRGFETGFGQAPLEKRVRKIIFPARHRTIPAAIAAGAICLTAAGAAWCMAPSPVMTVSVGECTLELPSYWQGRVEVLFDKDRASASVHLAGHPEVYLLKLFETTSSDGTRYGTIDYERYETVNYQMLWSNRSSSGRTYELWGLCYAGMSTNNDWKMAPVANPPYPGEEAEREAIDLSTGGAVSVDEARRHSRTDNSWFGFYFEKVVPGIKLP